MDLTTLENWLWEAACEIRGPLDAPKYKDYILPLLFFKRLCDVFEDDIQSVSEEIGDPDLVQEIIQDDRGVIRWYIPLEYRWDAIRKTTVGLGEKLTEALKVIARENPKLSGVIDRRDFNATEANQRILEDEAISRLMEVLNRHRLGLDDVEPDILGRAYEYLLRKFAEGSGQSAGEFFTPREVGVLMAHILDPDPGDTVYDPACGSGGLLIKAQLRLREKGDDLTKPLQLYGQEITADTFAMAKMNAFVHEMDAEIQRGDTMRNPRYVDAEGRLKQFDLVTANPMWNQKFPVDVYENDTFGRFERGYPPGSSADWGWIQHMAASLNDKGKMAVVLDTGAVSRGSGNQGSNKERDVRKRFVEGDLVSGGDMVETVILLPENLFFNTSAPGIILVVNKDKPHLGEILLINASQLFEKGRPKNFLTEEHIQRIYEVYRDWSAVEGLSAIISNEEAARNDFNLSPSRYVSIDNGESVLPLEEALVLLSEAEEERREADTHLRQILESLGLSSYLSH